MPLFEVTNNKPSSFAFSDARKVTIVLKSKETRAVDLDPSMAKILRSFAARDRTLGIEPVNDEGRALLKGVGPNAPRTFRMAPQKGDQVRDELAEALAESPDEALAPPPEPDSEEDPVIAQVREAAAAVSQTATREAPPVEETPVRPSAPVLERVRPMRPKRAPAKGKAK